MLNALSPLPSLEMVDNTDEARSYTETLVLDPLNPQQSPPLKEDATIDKLGPPRYLA